MPYITELFVFIANNREIASALLGPHGDLSLIHILCGNEETFDLKELYRCCEIARELTLKDEWRVGRVIARPYVGKKRGEFVRTSNRHDYALKPTGLLSLIHILLLQPNTACLMSTEATVSAISS